MFQTAILPASSAAEGAAFFVGGKDFLCLQRLGFGERLGQFGCNVAKAGTFFHGEFSADESFDLAKIFGLIVRDKGDRVAGCFGTAGAADAVDIIFGKRGHVEVDDVRDALNVDAACGDVGGDHDLVFAGLKAFQCPLTLALRAAGVDRDRFDACPFEAAADLVGTVLGAGKDQHAVHLVVLEHVQQQFDLVFLLDGIDMLRDRFDGVSLLADLYHFRMLLYPGGKSS